MLFTVTWLAIVIGANNIIPMDMRESKKFDTIEACQSHIEAHKERVPDILRGHIRAGWDVDIRVHGECKPVGEPT